MKHLFLIVFCISSLLVQSVFSCSLAGKSISGFDDTEYIFIGKVVDHTKAFESKELTQPGFGLVVKPEDKVFLPKTPRSYFEVFPIELWADCSSGGTSLEKLKKEFPVGSEIRVIAKESKYFLQNQTDGNIRLEDRPDEMSSIVLNSDKNSKRLTSADSFFDYKSFKYDMNDDSASKYLLPNFEIRKDLLRLKNSPTQKEKNDILNRLSDVPVCCNDLDFHNLFKTYASNETEFKLFYESRLKRELTEEEFNQYKILDEVNAELKKLGYSDTDIEKAIGKAISESTEISKRFLFEKSLKILKEPKN